MNKKLSQLTSSSLLLVALSPFSLFSGELSKKLDLRYADHQVMMQALREERSSLGHIYTYSEVKRAIHHYASRVLYSRDTLKLNVPYILGEFPYNSVYENDVNQEIPNDISDSQWDSMRHKIKKALKKKTGFQLLSSKSDIPKEIYKEAMESMNEIFQRGDINSQKSSREKNSLQTLRKRVKRLFDKMDSALLGLVLFQNKDRCGDGLSSGISLAEHEYLFAHKKIDENDVGFELANVLAAYKIDFLKKHQELVPDVEFQTTVLENLKQTYLGTLNPELTERQVQYPQMGAALDDLFSPSRVIMRFFEGEVIRIPAGYYYIKTEFQGLTAQRLLSLVMEAYSRGLNPHTKHGEEGPVISSALLDNYAAQDPIISASIEDGESTYFDGPRYNKKFFIKLLSDYRLLMP